MSANDLTANSLSALPADRESSNAKIGSRRVGRRNADVLGIAWLHGTLQASVYHRQLAVGSWDSQVAVRTLDAFETALDAAIDALGFRGTEVFLILEHDQFVHQAEQGPAFSDTAVRAYLRGRVQRYEKEREPVLWISQRTVSVRQDAAFLVHMLPVSFYGRLSTFLLARRLDLTRILPLVVPLQLALEHEAGAKEQMVLTAAEAGEATTIMVTRGNGELLFARTMLARWSSDPARIAVEVNRSLLYAKQQFGAVVARIDLVGSVSDAIRNEVQTKCGADKSITLQPSNIGGWLQLVARLTPRHPVNLVVANLSRKRRRQFLRRVLLATCWLGLGLMMLDSWTSRESLEANRLRVAQMGAEAPALTLERDRLRVRNAQLTRDRDFVRQVSEERLPPVAIRFLTYLSSIRGADTQFTHIETRWDATTAQWHVHLEGQIEADEETAGETLTRLQRQLEKSPLRSHSGPGARVLVPMPARSPDASPSFRFTLEGGLFEN